MFFGSQERRPRRWKKFSSILNLGFQSTLSWGPILPQENGNQKITTSFSGMGKKPPSTVGRWVEPQPLENTPTFPNQYLEIVHPRCLSGRTASFPLDSIQISYLFIETCANKNKTQFVGVIWMGLVILSDFPKKKCMKFGLVSYDDPWLFSPKIFSGIFPCKVSLKEFFSNFTGIPEIYGLLLFQASLFKVSFLRRETGPCHVRPLSGQPWAQAKKTSPAFTDQLIFLFPPWYKPLFLVGFHSHHPSLGVDMYRQLLAHVTQVFLVGCSRSAGGTASLSLADGSDASTLRKRSGEGLVGGERRYLSRVFFWGAIYFMVVKHFETRVFIEENYESRL